MLKDIFAFAEHQEKATYGLGYKLTLTRNTDNAVLNKDNAINKAKFKILLLCAMYNIILLVFQIKHCYPSRSYVKYRQNFKT